MDADLMQVIELIPHEDRGEIDFILNSPDFTDAQRNILIADIASKLVPIPPESTQTDD